MYIPTHSSVSTSKRSLLTPLLVIPPNTQILDELPGLATATWAHLASNPCPLSLQNSRASMRLDEVSKSICSSHVSLVWCRQKTPLPHLMCCTAHVPLEGENFQASLKPFVQFCAMPPRIHTNKSPCSSPIATAQWSIRAWNWSGGSAYFIQPNLEPQRCFKPQASFRSTPLQEKYKTNQFILHSITVSKHKTTEKKNSLFHYIQYSSPVCTSQRGETPWWKMYGSRLAPHGAASWATQPPWRCVPDYSSKQA